MTKETPKPKPVELTDTALDNAAGGLKSSVQKKLEDTNKGVIGKFG